MVRRPYTSDKDYSLFLIVLEIAFFIALWLSLYRFARVQDIWIDETTQLSGITLNFGEMLRWLGGHNAGRFGVPGDRMPPISYILDWAWLRSIGPSVLGFRLFHAGAFLLGVAVLFATARRNFGLAPSFLTLGILCLSPKMIGSAVEVRAYPLFFLVTCLQTSMFLGIMKDRTSVSPFSLTLFSVVSVIAIYTHFFGVVSGTAFFSSLVIAYSSNPVALLEVTMSLVSVAIASLGILPFVTFAASTPGALGGEALDTHRYVAYLFKLFGDSANMVSQFAAVLFYGGLGILFLMSAITAIIRLRTGRSRSVDWLLIVIMAGMAVPFGASLFVKTFDALKSSYSIWLFSPLAMFVGSGTISDGNFYWNKAFWVAAMGAMVGATISTCTFLVHASDFSHGPGRFIGKVYDYLEPPKAVIYDSGAAWQWSYFPLTYNYKGQIDQFRIVSKRELVRIVPGPNQPVEQELAFGLSSYKELLLVDVRLRTYEDVRECLMSACPEFPSSTTAALLANGGWQKTQVIRKFGLYDAQVQVFRRLN